MQFGYAEHEKDVRNYDTAEYNYMAFDELTSFTEFQYLYLAFSRCRTSVPELPAICRSASNPGNVGHGYVRKRFVEPARDGNTIIRETVKINGQEELLLRIFIPAKATDNPHIDPNYVIRMQMLPEAERRAKSEGDWWTFSGQVFEDWRIEPFRDEPERARHVIKPVDIPPWWPRILAIDWGFSAMMCALWASIDPATSRVYVYREHTALKAKISTWARTIARLSQTEEISDVVLDPSAWGKRGDEKTIAEQFEEHSGMSPRMADNERISGKLLIQEALRWEPKPRMIRPDMLDMDLARRILEYHGRETYNSYIRSMDDLEEEEDLSLLPQVQIFDTATELIGVLPLCVYNDPTTSKRGSPEDVAEFKGDDPYDTFRYLLKACQHYLGTGVQKNEEHAQIARAILALERTGDQTMYHIRMDSIESHAKRNSRGIKRFHRQPQHQRRSRIVV